MIFDDAEIKWKDNDFVTYGWTDFYHDAKESIPPNDPEPRGKSVQFVDASHTRKCINRGSHTGILIFMNTASITRYSKAQTTVESSMFGSEFVTMRFTADLIENLRYKL